MNIYQMQLRIHFIKIVDVVSSIYFHKAKPNISLILNQFQFIMTLICEALKYLPTTLYLIVFQVIFRILT